MPWRMETLAWPPPSRPTKFCHQPDRGPILARLIRSLDPEHSVLHQRTFQDVCNLIVAERIRRLKKECRIHEAVQGIVNDAFGGFIIEKPDSHPQPFDLWSHGKKFQIGRASCRERVEM